MCEIHLAIFSFYFLSVTWSPGNVQADATEMAIKPFLERTAQSFTCDGANDIYFLLYNAVTDFGTGETSTISILISLYFAQVRNLRASIDDNYNMAITWDRPNNFDKDDIKVPPNT